MVLNRMGESNAGTGAVAAHREARARTTSARRPRRGPTCTPAPSPVPGPIGRCSRGSDLRPGIGLLAARSGIAATMRVARRAAISNRQASHIVQSGHASASRRGSPNRARAPRPRRLARVIMCPPPSARRVGPCPHTSTQRQDAPPRRTRGIGGARRARRARPAGRPGRPMPGQMPVTTRSGRPGRPRRR